MSENKGISYIGAFIKILKYSVTQIPRVIFENILLVSMVALLEWQYNILSLPLTYMIIVIFILALVNEIFIDKLEEFKG